MCDSLKAQKSDTVKNGIMLLQCVRNVMSTYKGTGHNERYTEEISILKLWVLE